MKGKVLGKGILGMQKIENIEIEGMTIFFEINKKKMAERVIDRPSYLPMNCAQLNLSTASGKKICLKPETKKEINNLAENFGLDSKRKGELIN